MGAIIRLSSWEIPVLFEDTHLLVVDKPSGLPASPAGPDRTVPSLIGLLHCGIAEGKAWATQRTLDFLMTPERVDPEMSGVFILAKDKPACQTLADSFGSEKPYKDIITLVRGTPEQDQFSIEAKIAPDPSHEGRMRVDPKHGKRARTSFAVLESFTKWSLLKCQPLTHRPHQLRVHLRYARSPIVGDAVYGGAPLLLSSLKSDYRLKPGHTERPLISAPILHVASATFSHPATGSPLTITAPWPKPLTVAVKYLRRYSSEGYGVPPSGG
jgi:RluA family pseudouridine synthase